MEEQDMKAVQIVSPNNLQIIDVEKPSIDEYKNQKDHKLLTSDEMGGN